MATTRRQTRQTTTPDLKIQYLISKNDGSDFIIEVPADWKLTFGRVNPALSDERGYHSANGHCVRVWEGERLRAVFGDVTGMRDMTIPLARKVVQTESESSYKSDSLGNFEANSSRKLLDQGFVLEPDEDPFDDSSG